jgi:hypothetical protein
MTFWIVGKDGTFDPLLLFVATLFISMFVGVIITYCIHRIRVWRKLRYH